MTADTVGGVWTYALELAQAMAGEGVEFALATMGAPLTREQTAAARALPNLEVFESEYKLEWMPEPWEDVHAAGEWLLKIEQTVHPDVIHLNGYTHGAMPWTAPVLVVGHSCVVSWWIASKGDVRPPEWRRYRREVARGLRAADLVVAPSAAMLAELELHYGPLPPSRVVHNGRGLATAAPVAKEDLIFTAGRLWDEAKNVAVLDRVAPRLPWPVYAAGDLVHPDGHTARLRNLRMLGRLGPEAMADWFSRAAVYALPARYEPFGLSAVEAALAGCALVLGDIPSLREIWDDKAVFVPPDDPERIACAIRGLIEDTPVRRALALAAHERARELTPRSMADRYLAVYRSLIEDRAACAS